MLILTLNVAPTQKLFYEVLSKAIKAMSAQLKLGAEKAAGGIPAGQAYKQNPMEWGGYMKALTGKCEALKGEIFDCRQVKHLEVYY